ncbi:pectate lyase precursor [Sorangium sp. So ce295]|uniref:pectate lyase family protein n=1 Tax=Sorangium sp. So ce295 TaxID=3133295 RepID=UPI003F621367
MAFLPTCSSIGAQGLRRFGCAIAAVSALTAISAPASALPSFPGAEGFGAVATGGRGGRVIKVTNLRTSGSGSLQAALDASGPRIIVFDVSGVIEGDVVIRNGDVTIAGQTAPGAGITIRGRLTARYSTAVNNIIARFLRVRPVHDGSAGEQFDATQISRNSKVMLDHMSIAWGVDETVDLYEADDVTVQWSTIESSATKGHPEGMHNYGLINGPDGHRITLHHNLFAHHKARCPAVANGPADIRNNVAYNVRHGFVHHNRASGQFNIVGNTYIKGPSDQLIPFYFDGSAGAGLKYFLGDNYIDDPGKFTGTVENPWKQPYLHPSFSRLNKPESYRSATQFNFTRDVPGYIPVTTQRAQDAARLVAAQAGSLPRDVVTKGVFKNMERRDGSWGARYVSNLMEGLSPGSAPADADRDGMADAWERAHGLSSSNASDHTKVMPSGYTAIEEYINELAAALIRQAGGSFSMLPDEGGIEEQIEE